jgi:hypothetical protein
MSGIVVIPVATYYLDCPKCGVGSFVDRKGNPHEGRRSLVRWYSFHRATCDAGHFLAYMGIIPRRLV